MDKVIQIKPEDVLTAIVEGKRVIRIWEGIHASYLSNLTIVNIRHEINKPGNVFFYVEKEGGENAKE